MFRQNYHWWWRSFLISGCTGFYLLVFSVYYYMVHLELSRLSSTLIYFSTMLMISVCFSVMTGTFGFLSSYVFTRKIYAMIKGD
jgi:transmembrane 9 superfamily protein 2/4